MSYLGWAAAKPQSACIFSLSSFWCSLHASSGSRNEHPAQSSPPDPASPLWTEAEHTNSQVKKRWNSFFILALINRLVVNDHKHYQERHKAAIKITVVMIVKEWLQNVTCPKYFDTDSETITLQKPKAPGKVTK